MAWRFDPFLLKFLASTEQALARALEARHRDPRGEDESLTTQSQRERIASLERIVDALQVALERGESPVIH